jgi:prenyltransferase beta subunit
MIEHTTNERMATTPTPTPTATAATSGEVKEVKAPTITGSGDNVEEFTKRFYRDKHISFVHELEKRTDTFEYHVSEHLRMSGIYWGITMKRGLTHGNVVARCSCMVTITGNRYDDNGFGECT